MIRWRSREEACPYIVDSSVKKPCKEPGGRQALLIHNGAKELDLAQLSSMEVVMLRLTPLLESDLYVIIGLNGDKIAVLVFIPQSHCPLRDVLVGEPANLGIDAIYQGLIADIERND